MKLALLLHLASLWSFASGSSVLRNMATRRLLWSPLANEQPNLKPANNDKPFASMLNSALINGNVSLPCDISPGNQEDSVALVLWYKDDSMAPIYTLDARKASSLDKAKVSADDSYATRANFRLNTKPAELQLDQLRAQDEGDYRCRVDFRRGRSVNTIISLRVVEPPSELRVTDPRTRSGSRSRLDGLIGPYDEGAELVLQCIAFGGKPRPQVSWHQNYNLIEGTIQQFDKDTTISELRVPVLNKDHLLSIFTCQASNTNLTSPMQTSITIDLNLRPSEVKLRQVGQDVLVVGRAVTFECLSLGSRPQASIHWLFPSFNRSDPPMNVDQQQTSSRLTLVMERNFNGLPLTCVAENPRIAQQSSMSQSIKLDVRYAPQLSIRLEPTAASSRPDESPDDHAHRSMLFGEPQEGNDIYLSCQLDANPRPSKPVMWRFNGRPLQHQPSVGSPSSQLIMTNQSLVLRSVSRHQSGSYSCEASNQLGTGTSQPVELTIRHAPVCVSDDILTFEAAEGQTVGLECLVLANPSRSVHYSWFFAPENRISNLTDWIQRDAALDEQIDESGARLSLKLKDRQSFGWLKCKAKNQVGLQQQACLFRVQLAKTPTLAHSCQLAGQSSRQLQLQCQLNEHLTSQASELTSAAGSDHSQAARSSMSRWLDFEAVIRQQQPGSGSIQRPDGQTGADLVAPSTRLVYPPTWLLVEVLKWRSQDEHELVAYVVVGAGQQLARIKSIVEENHLLSSNPRVAHYVATRSLANETLAQSIVSKQDQLKLDPSIRLSDSFNFTVPALEPGTSYKLMIFGQNLANKTRDWISLNAKTIDDDLLSQPTSELNSEQHEEQLPAQSRASSGKSLVLRGSGSQTLDEQTASSSSLVHRLTIGSSLANLSLTDQLHQLSHYSDQAISLARQKPVFAIGLVSVLLIVASALVIWTLSGLFTILRRPSKPRHSLANHKDTSGSGSGSGSSSMEIQLQSKSDYSLATDRQPNDGSPAKSSPNSTDSAGQHNNSGSSSRGSSNTNYADNRRLLIEQTQFANSDCLMEHNGVYTIEQSIGEPQSYATSRQLMANSLDRRQLTAASQPIYLASEPIGSHHHYHRQVGSIDRRSSYLANAYSSQPPLLVGPFGQLAQLDPMAGLYFGQEQLVEGTDTGSLYGAVELRDELPLLARPSIRQQRVAFDLSNQQLEQRHEPCKLANCRQLPSRSALSPKQVAASESTDHLRGPFKGSDSGGSNSGATADSGHESPNTTGETASLSFRQHAPHCATLKAPQGCCSSSGKQQPNDLLMLMQMSPSSQESSTLLQSQDSFLDSQQQQVPMIAEGPSSDNNVLTRLRSNHQMATSFVARMDNSLPVYLMPRDESKKE